MLTQAAVRSDAFRVVPNSAFSSAARPAGRPAYGSRGEIHSLDENLMLMGATMSYPRNTEIFGENEPADYVYKVVSGSVRTYNILSDGRRQIGGFYLPGDIFGIEFDGEHTSAAEAISDAKILVIKRSALDALAGRDASVARELFALTARELRRVQDRILLLIKSAQERVAGFLLEMAKRASGGNAIDLPMSRQDIADYLGLTIETVSRTLTSLETAAAIDVPTSRRIVLRNRSALTRMNG
jgi:CRP/FNR family transcriptional regulator, nitrogen fixation regulation protein